MSVAHRGDLVRIGWIVLEPGARAPGVPEDTGGLPFKATTTGFLIEEAASVGDAASVTTPTSRILHGTLIEVDPAPRIDYGRPQAELLAVRMLLREEARRDG